MIENDIPTYLSQHSAAGSCAYHHEKGDHKNELCKVPEGYCAFIGHLVLTHQEILDELAEAKRNSYTNVVSGGGASVVTGYGGSGSSNAIGGCAGGGAGAAGGNPKSQFHG